MAVVHKFPQRKKPARFSWSFSRLKNFRTCPKRSYECDIAKNFKDESEHIDWGQEVHKAAASHIGRGVPIPNNMKGYEDQITRFAGLNKKFHVKVEQQLAINEDFLPTEWFGTDAWFRTVADVLALQLDKGNAVLVDWKTGKLPRFGAEYEQLALSACVVFAHYPEVQVVQTYYEWLQEKESSPARFFRHRMTDTWNQVWPHVQRMKRAFDNQDYPATPNPFCRNFCPVTTCEFHGKGK